MSYLNGKFGLDQTLRSAIETVARFLCDRNRDSVREIISEAKANAKAMRGYYFSFMDIVDKFSEISGLTKMESEVLLSSYEEVFAEECNYNEAKYILALCLLDEYRTCLVYRTGL